MTNATYQYKTMRALCIGADQIRVGHTMVLHHLNMARDAPHSEADNTILVTADIVFLPSYMYMYMYEKNGDSDCKDYEHTNPHFTIYTHWAL